MVHKNTVSERTNNTSVMADPAQPVNPSVTMSSQYANSNIMFYPSVHIYPRIPSLQHPHTHTTQTQYGMYDMYSLINKKYHHKPINIPSTDLSKSSSAP